MKPKKLSFWKATGLGLVGALKIASNAPAQETAPVEKPLKLVKQESPIDVTSKTDFFSKYIYRGMNFSNDDKPVVQQNVIVNYDNFTFWGFGNYDTESGKINEEDLIIDYTIPVNEKENLLLSTGWAVFTFPNTDFKSTQEVYAALSLDDEKLLNPSVMFVHDFKDGDGNYLEGKISKDFDVGIPVSTTTKLGYNDHYYRKDSGFSHLEFTVSSPIELGKNTTITPSVTYQNAIDRKDFEDELCLGLSLAHNF